MPPLTLARNAMNTRFEVVLHDDSPAFLRAAAEEALAEVERIENQLSLFRPGSEIARVNALAAREPVRVSPEVFNLLAHARRLSAETGGAFDITMAPLLRCWGLLGRADGHVPSPDELAAARAVCGMDLVELDAAHYTVRFARPGVMLDLGAVGKGYGVEQAAEILRDAGVTSALIHGGTSTVHALGAPPGEAAWKVAIDTPKAATGDAADPSRSERLDDDLPPVPLATISLRDESLSVSAAAGKYFVAGGRMLGHVIAPHTGEPAANARIAIVVLPSATETDALSTALLVVGIEGHDPLAALRPHMRTLVGRSDAGEWLWRARGIEPKPTPIG